MLPKVHAHMATHGLDLAKLAIVPNGISPDDWLAAAAPLREDVQQALDGAFNGGAGLNAVPGLYGLWADQITPIPGADGEGECDYLLGLGDAGGRRLILIDIDRLMSIKREAGMAQPVA